MKAKRNDLRLSRKTKPRKYVSKHDIKERHANPIRNRRLTSRKATGRSRVTHRKRQRIAKSNKTTVPEEPPEYKAIDSSLADKLDAEVSETRRKRPDASEYIKRRFLYDSSDVSKNKRHVGSTDTRPSNKRSVLQGNGGFRLRKDSRNKSMLSNQINLGRDTKSKLRRDVDDLLLDVELINNDAKPVRKRGTMKRHLGVSSFRNALETAEPFDPVDPIETVRSRKRTSHSRNKKNSNTKLREFDEPFDYINGSQPDSLPRKVSDEKCRLLDVIEHKRTLSPGSDIHADSLIDFSDDHSSHYDSRPYEEMDAVDEAYLRPPLLRNSSEERNQPPNEDLEEEDLLAPELSVLSGSTAADSIIVQNAQNLLSFSQSSGTSRRKSPVRPMQVIRTKPVTPTTNTSSSLLGSNADSGALVYTHSPTYTRRLSGDDASHDELSSFHRHVVDTNRSRSWTDTSGLKSSSISHQSNNFGTTSIKVRPIRDRLPSGDDSDIKTPTVNQQFGPRMFVGNSSRPIQTSSGKLTVPFSHSSVTRRRPSILKRGANTGTGHTVSVSERSNETTQAGDNKTIDTFSSNSTQSRKPSLIQSSPATVAATVDAGPTKLLQLVTASSLIAPLGPTPLTASDKLFGRRNQTHSAGSVGFVPVPAPRYTDFDKSRTGNTGQTANSQPPYRYAVLRGGPGGKRYLVLGSSEVFDRAAITASKIIEPERPEEKSTQMEKPANDSTQADMDNGASCLDLNSHSSRPSESEMPQSRHAQSICGNSISSAPGIMVTSVVAT